MAIDGFDQKVIKFHFNFIRAFIQIELFEGNTPARTRSHTLHGCQ